MKALSLNADFAMLVLLGKKTIECRTWRTNYRGDILICANSKKIKGTIPGHGLCVVKLEDIRPIEPIPIKGRLSLFEVDVNPVFLPRTCDITDEEADAIVRKYYSPIII